MDTISRVLLMEHFTHGIENLNLLILVFTFFDKEKSRVIGYVDSILYECIPAKFIKRIFRQYNCLLDGKVYSAKAPKAPLLNSNYDGSFIAGMLQLRYIYSMPVERIVKYFAEHGFEMNKSTAHGLIKKSAWMMERLDKALKKTILVPAHGRY